MNININKCVYCVPSCAICNEVKNIKTPLEFIFLKETQVKEAVVNV
jgi:hypothetical protein